MNSNHHIPVSSKYSPSPICSPENSPELQNLSDRIQVNFSDIFTKNITPQMAELLGRLPMFDELVSRKYRIFSNIIYHFITSRGYTIAQSTQNNQRKYNEAVNTFIKRGKAIGAMMNIDIFVETTIVSGVPRGNTSYKYYQTFDEEKWEDMIKKLPELYGMISREFPVELGEKISAKFPRYLTMYEEKCDNLVIYCRDQRNLSKIQVIVERWIQQYHIPIKNRPFYRSAFGVDGKLSPGENKTSFSDLCANLAIKYANDCDIWNQKKGNILTDKEYNIIALAQACMMASCDPKGFPTKTKR